ncbi:hypothetical protein BVAD3_40740 (plasmid) [Bacillus velezensis]|nr:hypothetical protein BVAD3_40740 [Bacillus velezensis]
MISMFFVMISALPLSIYLVLQEVEETGHRQWDEMMYRLSKIEGEIRKEGGAQNIPPSFYKALLTPGTVMEIESDGISYNYRLPEIRAPREGLHVHLENAFIDLFIKRELKDADIEIQKHKRIFNNMKINVFKSSNDDTHVHAEIIVVLANGENDVKVTITKNITSALEQPICEYMCTLPIWLLWFIIAATLSTYFGINVAFKPLGQALQKGFVDVKESNYTKRFDITAKYGKEIAYVKKNINEMLGHMENVLNQNTQALEDISHEVNTHLTAIKQSVDILNIKGIEDEEAFNHRISTISHSVKRINQITSTILELSRLRQRPTTYEAETYPLRELLSTYVNYLTVLYPEFHFEVNYPKDKLGVFIEKNHFFVAVKPVMENAVKYSLYGNIRIEVKEIDRYVGISITNWGIEIKDDEIPRIFERYFRGEASDEFAAGSGLGLNVTDEVLKLYGGYIDVSSVPDGAVHRTTFVLWFPKEICNIKSGAEG